MTAKGLRASTLISLLSLTSFLGLDPAAAAAQTLPSAGGLDPCTLVTAEEVAAILGDQLGPPRRMPLGPELSACFWSSTSTSGGSLAIYAATVPADGGVDPRMQALSEVEGVDVRDEEGLGDHATSFTLRTEGANLAQVTARKGRQVVMIQLRREGAGGGEEADRDRARRAADLAVGRLP